MLDAQMKNALKVGGIAIVLLVVAIVALPLALVLALVGIPAMVYYAFFVENAPFPKPWKSPLK